MMQKLTMMQKQFMLLSTDVIDISGGEIGIAYSTNECGRNPTGNYMFKVNNRNTRTRCEICSKLTIKTPERR